MDTRKAITELEVPYVQHVAFSEGQKYFTVCAGDTFAVWLSETCEKYTEQDVGGVGTASMLGSSKILALSSMGTSPTKAANKVTIWDCMKQEQQALITTSAPVLRTRFTSTHLIVIMENKVNLYRHKQKLEKLASFDTSSNLLGLGCINEYHVVIPGRTAGQMQIVDLQNIDISIVPAHSSPLQALAVSPDGAVAASASRQGTLIRLHSTTTCTRLGEVRRGIAPATIFSIAFSPSSNHLATTSHTNTLHIFEVPKPGSQQSRPASAASYDRHSPSPPVEESVGFQKWGGLAKLPFAPRVFSDVYSVASASFDPGVEDESSRKSGSSSAASTALKGVLGWTDDETLVVVNGGGDARYERFAFVLNDEGRPVCFRVGWSRYMRPN